MNDWQNVNSAPRDGTVIELKNDWGIAPWYGLFKWVRGQGWVDARDENSGCGDGEHLTWRPFEGDITSYDDPTHGEQVTPEYWRRAARSGNRGWVGNLIHKLTT